MNWHTCDRPVLTAGHADFWRIKVPRLRPTSPEFWLSTSEQRRAARFHRPADSQRFIIGRIALKYLLGTYLALKPQRLNLTLGDHGKPYLAEAPDLQFSLSHSGGWIVIGFCEKAAVGVDIERIGSADPQQFLPINYLSAEERHWVDSVSADARGFAAHEAWIRKEAYLKMIGSGLVDNLDAIGCQPSWSGQMWVTSLGSKPVLVALHESPPAPGYVSALVCSNPEVGVKRWTFTSWPP